MRNGRGASLMGGAGFVRKQSEEIRQPGLGKFAIDLTKWCFRRSHLTKGVLKGPEACDARWTCPIYSNEVTILSKLERLTWT